MKPLPIVLGAVSYVLFGCIAPALGCTAFYATDGEFVVVGNNEDCPDSVTQAWAGTHMWFVPPEDSTYGKVCFGYGELHPYGAHFSQGGMNEAGLFFDGFSTPYNEITESLEKPIYDGPLTERVLDQCSSVEEALALYGMYNLQAQYMETYQLMFGDTYHNAAIIEGDSTITLDGWYQVCTNFYQSDPELGGYPCWRYDLAADMLEDCDELSVEFTRSVLDAVHSEGLSTTQYATIYDLNSRLTYLFFGQNFDESITIDLDVELAKGAASYELSSLFADMQLIEPDHGAVVSPSSVTFRWSGKPDCDYELYYSENPDFAGSEPIGIVGQGVHVPGTAAFSLVLVGLVPLGLVYRKRRLVSLLVLLVAVLVVMASCDMQGVMENEDDDGVQSITVHSLEPNTTYYWKVTAQASDHFTSESIVKTFTTGP